MNIVAVDPGAIGGICWYAEQDKLTFAKKMPDTHGDLLELFKSIKAQGVDVAAVEAQTGCAGIKVSAPAMFKFGTNYGAILGMLMALGFRVELVRPQEWQKAFSLGTAKEAGGRSKWKAKLKAEAQRRFPGIAVTLGTADALLILDWALHRKTA